MIRVEDEREKAILEQFKTRTEDIAPDEIVCLRFLRARDHDLPKAEEMLRKSCKWRMDNDIGSYGTWIPPNVLVEYGVTFSMTGHDFDGRAVIFVPLGKFDAKDLITAGHKKELMSFVYHLLESLTNFISQSCCSQCIVVLDLEDLSLRQLLHMETMQTCYSAFQNLELNYPEILHSLLVVNAPWIFPIGFNFIRPILSKHTLSKMQIFNAEKEKWIKALMKIMPKETIPLEYFKMQ